MTIHYRIYHNEDRRYMQVGLRHLDQNHQGPRPLLSTNGYRHPFAIFMRIVF